MKQAFSIASYYYYDLSPEDAVKEFIKDGIFDSELAFEHAQTILERNPENPYAAGAEFKSFLDLQNFSMKQGHLSLGIPFCRDESELNRLFSWIDLFVGIGVKEAVLHGDKIDYEDISYQEKLDRNIAVLKRVAEYIKGKDIRICLENTYFIFKSIDEINYVIDGVGSDQMCICLDTGHLNRLKTSSQRDFILKAGKRLRALHIADNWGDKDLHLLPFGLGNVDFVEVGKALNEIGYSGYYNFEVGVEAGGRPLAVRRAKIPLARASYEFIKFQK